MKYPSIRIEGSIISSDVLEAIENKIGQKPEQFGLEQSAKVKDEIARAWADAKDYWRIFQRKLEGLKNDSVATTETRQQWVVPLLGLLGYQLEPQAKGVEYQGKIYRISHRAINRANTPVHIIGYREEAGLDRKPMRGGIRTSAHGVVQEYLNLHDELYGLVSNGKIIRLLRDNSRLIKLSYLEFDLERIFTDDLFADFAVFYRLLHATRFPLTNENSSQSLIEQYHQNALDEGTRIRKGLRLAVKQAIEILGDGFLNHPKNQELRVSFESGETDSGEYFNFLLRLIYRLLFLCVVEDRNLIFPSGTPQTKIKIYSDFYSLNRLRRLAQTRGLRHKRYDDAWLGLGATFKIFEDQKLADNFGITAFGGQLFNEESLGPLATCCLSNKTLFDALDRLCYFDDPETQQRVAVNFRSLQTEEFGSVYESLLELHPIVEVDPAPKFSFLQAAGNDRKKSGSYYTPTSLVNCLLDNALDPILEERIKQFPELGFPTAEEAILDLKICDPASGSGHFLIAAAQRIARRLAFIRVGEEEPAPEQIRHAMRQVISKCIYAVDINPMSVELCRVALWLEGMEPGKPLSFLDHHIRCGNSLIGATPELIIKGIPDSALKAVEGDDSKTCAALMKINKAEHSIEADLFEEEASKLQAKLQEIATSISELPDDDLAAIRAKQMAYADLQHNLDLQISKKVADLWCAAFFIKKRWRNSGTGVSEPVGITQKMMIDFAAGEPSKKLIDLMPEIQSLAEDYRFFHWHLEFPEVFEEGGFDIVLGNPPWEQVKLSEEEFFAALAPDISNAKNAAARKRMISALPQNNPTLAKKWQEAASTAECESQFLRASGRFPYGGVGDVNTYAVFTDLFSQLIKSKGTASLLIKDGLVVGYTYRKFLRKLLTTKTLHSFYGFENEDQIFPEVHHSTKFGAVTITGAERQVEKPVFTAYIRQPDQIHDAKRTYSLSAKQIEAINPNTHTIPIFRWSADATVLAIIHTSAPPFIKKLEKKVIENQWGITFCTLFHMSGDSGVFIDHETVSNLTATTENALAVLDDGSKLLPLYEGKMLWHFDHRYGTYNGQTVAQANQGVLPHVSEEAHKDPDYKIQPRYWVNEAEVNRELGAMAHRKWFFAWRDVGPSERTFVGSIIPKVAAGDTMYLMSSNKSTELFTALVALLSSFVIDFDARQKSSRMKYFVVEQLAILPPERLTQSLMWLGTTAATWFSQRVLELSYTSFDLQPFARELGYKGLPFCWDPARRSLLEAEINAATMHLYELTREHCERILDSFTVLQKYEEKAFGEFQTKRLILDVYDRMAEARKNQTPFQTQLNPVPSHLSLSHSSGHFTDVESLDAIEPIPIVGTREEFVYRYLPYIVDAYPGLREDMYRDAVLLASQPDRLAKVLQTEDGATRLDMRPIFQQSSRVRLTACLDALRSLDVIIGDFKETCVGSGFEEHQREWPMDESFRELLQLAIAGAKVMNEMRDIAGTQATVVELNDLWIA